MRTNSLLILLIFLSYISFSALASEDKWLLWDTDNSSLPTRLAYQYYPPVILFRQGNDIFGSLSASYSFESEEDPTTNDFRIIIVDSENTAHILAETNRSIGFINGRGMSLVTLKSSGVSLGDVTIKIYKKNTLKNREELKALNEKVDLHMQKVQNELDSLKLKKMVVNEKWSLQSNGVDGSNYDISKINSDWTIIDLYSRFCSPCVRAIPQLNELHLLENIYVVGLSGVEDIATFNTHLNESNVKFPMIPFTGKYMDAALPKALDTIGYPTYFLLDSDKKLVGKFSGINAIKKLKKYIRI